MKKILFIFFFSFFLSNIGNSNSITAHDIAGLFIGDSALNFTSEEMIKANKKNWYKNKEITSVSIAINNPDYDVMSFSYRTNDPSYKVLQMTGMRFFRTNFQECLKRKDKTVKNHDMAISSELKNSFDAPLPQDSSGKSKSYNTKYTFDNGDIIFIACYDWSEETGKGDHFRYGILSNEFAKWVRGVHK